MPATPTMKTGADIKVGDYIELAFVGSAQVKTLTPYTGPLLDVMGAGSQVATFHGSRLEMTLAGKSLYEMGA